MGYTPRVPFGLLPVLGVFSFRFSPFILVLVKFQKAIAIDLSAMCFDLGRQYLT